MRHGPIRGIVLSVLALPCCVGLAQGMVSGGASLPLPLYREAMSTLPADTFLPYMEAGSTAGLRAFLRNTPDSFGHDGGVHWVGSEAPLTSTQISDYLMNGPGHYGDPAGHGPLIQIPIAYVPIMIAYKGPSVPVSLTRPQLCAIFSGRIDRWSQLGVAVAPSLDGFKLIYRADGSGTTELLTRHLRQACDPHAFHRFSGKAVFAKEFEPAQPPEHFMPAQGDSGVAVAMAGNVSAITYIGPDPAYTVGLKPAWLVNANDGVAYWPTPANVNAAMAAVDVPVSGSAARVVRHPGASGWSAPDNAANPANWVQIQPDPPSGYPIVGSTNIVLSQCYSDPSAVAAMRSLLKRLLDDSSLVSRHQLVPLPAALRAQLRATFIQAPGSAALLNIGNPSVCDDVAGRG